MSVWVVCTSAAVSLMHGLSGNSQYVSYVMCVDAYSVGCCVLIVYSLFLKLEEGCLSGSILCCSLLVVLL